MELPGKKMICRLHGEATPCLICSHLHKGASRGFHAAQAPRAQPSLAHMPEAWCDRCEFWRTRPALIADLYETLFGERLRICEHCLELIRTGNEKSKGSPGWWEK